MLLMIRQSRLVWFHHRILEVHQVCLHYEILRMGCCHQRRSRACCRQGSCWACCCQHKEGWTCHRRRRGLIHQSRLVWFHHRILEVHLQVCLQSLQVCLRFPLQYHLLDDLQDDLQSLES